MTDPRIPLEDAHKLDAGEHIGSNPSTEPSIGEVISRRAALRGLLAVTALPVLGGEAAAAGPSSFTFPELAHHYDGTHHVAEGYDM